MTKPALIRFAVVAFCAFASFVLCAAGIEVRGVASDFEASSQVYALGTMTFVLGGLIGMGALGAALAPTRGA